MASKNDNAVKLSESLTALQNDKTSPVSWILVECVSREDVHFSGSGKDEDLTKLASLLRVQAALVRLTGVPQDEQCGFRDVFITWTGPNAGILKKRKYYELQDTIDRLFAPYHASVSVNNREKFDLNTYVYHLSVSGVWAG